MEINLTNCIILTHTYIRENESYKIAPIEFAVKHFRKNNPNDYIMLVGHGLRPTVDCDYMYWEDTINEKDINVGHPRLCNIAYSQAESKNFSHILKSRADSIHLIENICDYAKDLLNNKKMLVTQQTTIDRQQIGDLFLYGNLDFIKKCWNIETWYPTNTGIKSLAKNFLTIVDEPDWHSACVNNLSFADIYKLKWICLQKNWTEVSNNQDDVYNNKLSDWHKYLWGSKQKWHTWNEHGELVYSKPKVGRITTEKDWK